MFQVLNEDGIAPYQVSQQARKFLIQLYVIHLDTNKLRMKCKNSYAVK